MPASPHPSLEQLGTREGAPQRASALHGEGEWEKHGKPGHSAASVASLQRTLQLSPTLHPSGEVPRNLIAAPPWELHTDVSWRLTDTQEVLKWAGKG